MFYTPAIVRRAAFNNAFNNALSNQFLNSVAAASTTPTLDVTQDESSYAFSVDVPGIAKEHLNIGIEGNVVRIESVAEAKRQYKVSYELPQDIDVSASEAKLEHGVLTIKLAKLVPVSKVTTLPIH
jgi:HSP20 family protein